MNCWMEWIIQLGELGRRWASDYITSNRRRTPAGCFVNPAALRTLEDARVSGQCSRRYLNFLETMSNLARMPEKNRDVKKWFDSTTNLFRRQKINETNWYHKKLDFPYVKSNFHGNICSSKAIELRNLM